MEPIIKKRHVLEQAWIFMLLCVLAVSVLQLAGFVTEFTVAISVCIVLVPLAVTFLRLSVQSKWAGKKAGNNTAETAGATGSGSDHESAKDLEADPAASKISANQVLAHIKKFRQRLVRPGYADPRDAYQIKCYRSAINMLVATSLLILLNSAVKLAKDVWVEPFVESFSLLMLPMLFYAFQTSLIFGRQSKDALKLCAINFLGLFFSIAILSVRLLAFSDALVLSTDGKIMAEYLLCASVLVFGAGFCYCLVSWAVPLVQGIIQRFHGHGKSIA